MKPVRISKEESRGIGWGEACVVILGPLLVITLLAVGLWLMPISITISGILILLALGLAETYREDRADRRKWTRVRTAKTQPRRINHHAETKLYPLNEEPK